MGLFGLDWSMCPLRGAVPTAETTVFGVASRFPPSSHHLLSCPALSRTALENSAPPRPGSFWHGVCVMPNCPVCVRSTVQTQTHVRGSVNTRNWEHTICMDQPAVSTQKSSDNRVLSNFWFTEVSWFRKEETQSYVTFCSWLNLLVYRNQTLLSASCCCINHVAIMSQAEITNGHLHKQLPCSSRTTAMTDSILCDHTVLSVPFSMPSLKSKNLPRNRKVLANRFIQSS